MKAIRTLTTWILLIPLFALQTIPLQTAIAFTDVQAGDYHFVAINALEEMAVISGNPDGSFRANQDINRAEVLKIMLLASGEYTEEAINEEFANVSEPPFPDTAIDQWYTKYVYFAKERGIVQGYDDGNFHPEETINLAETLKIYLESRSNIIYPLIEDNSFEDIPADSWYAQYFAYASSRGALDIQLSNQANPNQTMSRGYVTEILYRMQKFGEGYEFGKATFYGSAIQGSGTASGETFDMNEFTAAHKTLPFGTLVEVSNLANGQSVQVRIIDRGPYGAGRVIDLSSSAFKEIASLGAGVVNVQIKVVE